MYAPSCSSRVSWFTVAIKSAKVGGFLRLLFDPFRFMDGMLSRVRASREVVDQIDLQACYFERCARLRSSQPHTVSSDATSAPVGKARLAT